jgi:hypothetical protein
VRSLVPLFLLLCLVAPAGAGTVVLEPLKDNTLFQDADGDTSSGAGPALFAGNRLPDGAVIDGVVLTLHVSSTSDSIPRLFTLHRVVRDWGEGQSSSAGGSGAPATAGDATWLHTFYPTLFWSAPGGDFDPAPSTSLLVGGSGSWTWSSPAMISDVRGWLDHPLTSFGWLVQGDETGPRTVRRFDSRESESFADRPTLTIQFSTVAASHPTSWGGLKACYRR